VRASRLPISVAAETATSQLARIHSHRVVQIKNHELTDSKIGLFDLGERPIMPQMLPWQTTLKNIHTMNEMAIPNA
jgi:hypothetical protein